jgi:hypothetical protein
MRPCDCKDEQDTKKLQENGIRHNDDSLVVTPNFVTLKLGHTTVTMSMHRFKQFAEWYLEDQDKKTNYRKLIVSDEVTDLLHEMNEYLDSSDEAAIGSGSITHDQIKAILKC